MALAKLEGRFTVPTGGWGLHVIEDTGDQIADITIPAADYYISTTGTGSNGLLDELIAQLDADGTLNGDYSGALSATTGLITISASGVDDFEFDWEDAASDEDLMLALGFSGSESYTTTVTTDNQPLYVWLPNCERENALAPEAATAEANFGVAETDGTFTMAPSGASVRLYYGTRWFDNLQWGQILGSKCWKGLESTTNESLQRFWEDVIRHGYPVRFHKDATSDAVYQTGVVENMMQFQPSPTVAGWTSGANSLWSMGFKFRKYVSS
jgi:hypothetical protein